jgi:hypothetical protein
VTGQLGVSQSGISTATCLSKGETSYLFGIELDLFSEIAQISIGSLDSSNSSFTVSTGKIIPQSYNVDSIGFLDNFSTTVKQESNGALKLGVFSHYFLLDEEGAPLIWGFYSPPEQDVPINFGESKTLQGTLIYEGDAKKVKAFIDFEPFNSSLVSLTNDSIQPVVTRFNNYQIEQYRKWLSITAR